MRVLAWNPRGGIYHATEEGWYQTLQNIVTCDKVMNEEDRVKRVKSQTILRSGEKYLRQLFAIMMMTPLHTYALAEFSWKICIQESSQVINIMNI